jgi:GTPase SAR1 family protein
LAVADHIKGANGATQPFIVQGGATALEALDLEVHHDPEAVAADMLAEMRGLEMRLHGGRVAQAIGQTILDRVRKASAAIAERAASPFRLCVLGEFKRGKSTLVNALLGERVAPVDPLPETVTVNRFKHGAAFSAEMRLAGGGRIALRREHLPRSALLPIIEAAPSEPLGIDVQLPNALLEDLMLVDTPGTGEVNAEVARLVREEIGAADMLVVVINVLSPLSETERTLLRHAVQPQDFPKILFVVNMIDLLQSEADVERVRASVAGELGQVFPGMRLHMLSSQGEVQRIGAANTRPATERIARFDAMFDAFRAELGAIVSGQRAAIRTDRLGVACNEVLVDIEVRVKLLARSLAKRGDELQRELALQQSAALQLDQDMGQRSAELTDAVGRLSGEAQMWMRGFAQRLVESFPTQLEGLSRADIEREMQFYITSRVEAAIGCCLEAHVPAFEALGRQLLGETAEIEFELGNAARSAAASAFTGAQWNVGQTIRFALDQVLGLGLAVDVVSGLLTAVAPGVDSRQFIAALVRERHSLADAFASAVASTYTAIGGNMASQLRQEYGGRREALLDANRQAELLQREEAGGLASADASLQEALEWTRAFSSKLEDLRSRVVLAPAS